MHRDSCPRYKMQPTGAARSIGRAIFGFPFADSRMPRQRRRANAADVTLLAFRFSGDSICPAARFDRLERAFNGRLEAHVISTPDAAHKLDDDAHSVLTYEFESADPNDTEHPTRQARRRFLEFLGERLLGT